MSNNLRIPTIKLATDRSNWVTYQDRMICTFNSRGWADHLTSTTFPAAYIIAGNVNGQSPVQCWAVEEARSKQLIVASVPDDIFNRIKSKTSTMEVWNTIKAHYQSRSKMITVDLGTKLQDTKLGDEDDTQAHFTRLLDLREQLASIGKILDDTKFASLLLNSLPASYEATIGVINAAADCTGNPITLEQVIELITDEYNRQVIKAGKNGSEEASATNFQRCKSSDGQVQFSSVQSHIC